MHIPVDEFVVVSFGSASHDPARFSEPERFDIRRDAGGHLAFGHGIHHCMGAPLDRLQCEIAVGALLDRFDRIELAVAPQDLQYETSLARGLEELPVQLG